MTAGRLLQAAREGNEGLVRALLDEGTDIEEMDSYGNTALMTAARWGHAEITLNLLAEGADVNASRSDGMTPLMLGVFSTHGDVVRALLAAGADRNAQDSLGMTALGWARAKGLTEIERILSGDVADAAATAGAHEVVRPAVTQRAGELASESRAAATDMPADDIPDLPEVEQAPPTEGESDPSLKPQSSSPQFESVNGTAQLAPVKFLDNPEFPLTAPSPTQSRLAGQANGELPGPAAAEDNSLPRRESAGGGVVVYRLRNAGLALATMIVAFVATWIFLDIKEGVSPRAQTAPAASSGGPEATNRMEGAGATEQPGSRGADAAGESSGRGDEVLLTAALGDWVAATNNRDIETLMGFYAPELSTFYRRRKASSRTVMREKARLLAQPHDINIRVSEPTIRYSGNPLQATLRFRKNFTAGGQRTRPSEVIQELVWQKTGEGWKIVSERDIRVIRR